MIDPAFLLILYLWGTMIASMMQMTGSEAFSLNTTPRDGERRIVYFIRQTAWIFGWPVVLVYATVVNTPRLVSWLFERVDKPEEIER